MGNDGGSIPDRRDLVKSKPKAEQADKQNQVRARWFFCALSKRPLQEPIVSCALGKLYNKDALLEYLLDKSAFGDGEEICGHIRSLKDVVTLKLTPNPISPSKSSIDDGTADFHPRFVCPLTQKEMTGIVPFVYISVCGCVFSTAALKAMTRTSSPKEGSSPKEKDEDKPGAAASSETQKELCPNCGAKYDASSDVRSLNPSEEESQLLRFALDAARAAEKPKKSKKRKVDPSADDANKKDEPSKKKAKAETVGVSPSVAAASRALAAGLAMEEAKRKAGMSEAVKSLYGDGKTKVKETFMTRGTFTRYA
jgi:hypothetical protein